MGRIAIEANRCQGHNMCQTYVPDLLMIDDFGFAVPIDHDDLTDDQIARARDAISDCPEQAIVLQERH